MDAACSVSSSLAPVCQIQLMSNNPPPSPSATAILETKEDLLYCSTCTPLGRKCPCRQTNSDWDEEEEEDTKEKGQEGQDPEARLKLASVALAQTLQPPKPLITQYFDNMLNNPPIRVTPRDRGICEIIVAQQELNETVCEIPEQEALDER